MKELSKKELIGWLEQIKFWYTKEIKTEEDEQAYQQIHKLIEERPKVTKKEIFDFHVNLMKISEDRFEDNEDLWKRERRYIEHWLKSKGMDVEK